VIDEGLSLLLRRHGAMARRVSLNHVITWHDARSKRVHVFCPPSILLLLIIIDNNERSVYNLQ